MFHTIFWDKIFRVNYFGNIMVFTRKQKLYIRPKFSTLLT